MKLFTILLLLFLITIPCQANFLRVDKPTIGLSSTGDSGHKHYAFHASYPYDIKILEGQADVAFTFLDTDSESLRDLNLKLETGHRYGFLALKGFGKYGKYSAMSPDNTWRFGGYLEAYLYETDDVEIATGIGTWADGELIGILGVTDEPSGDTPEEATTGLQVHVYAKYKRLSVLTEVVPLDGFKAWHAFTHPSIEVPLYKGLSFIVAGSVDYYTEPRWDGSEQFQYSWKHFLRWGF